LGNLDIPIMSGIPITDRKSIFQLCFTTWQLCNKIQTTKQIGKFQAFIAKVESVSDTEQVMQQLLSNKKIAAATHNMVAYRIQCLGDNGQESFIEFRDDDGEGVQTPSFALACSDVQY
jgi:hypothetical protein